MSQPDAVEVLFQVVESTLEDTASPARLRGAVAALAAVGDSRAIERLMELADRTDSPELAEAAARELCDLAEAGPAGGEPGLAAAEWILRDGGKPPVRRWQAAARAIASGARADLRRLGFWRRFGLAFRGAGGLPRVPAIAAVLPGLVLSGALLTAAAFFPALASVAEGMNRFQLAAVTFAAALLPAALSAFIFLRVARPVPWRAGGWGIVAAETSRTALAAAAAVLAVGFFAEFGNWAFESVFQAEATGRYRLAAGLTGLSTVACIAAGRVLTVLLGGEASLWSLSRVCGVFWAAASAIIVSFVAAEAMINGASFFLPVLCVAIAATAILTFGEVEAAAPAAQAPEPSGKAGLGRWRRRLVAALAGATAILTFGTVEAAAPAAQAQELSGKAGRGPWRRRLIAALAAAGTLTAALAVLTVRVGALAEETAGSGELPLDWDGKVTEYDVPICSGFAIRTRFNQTVEVVFRTGGEDIMTRAEYGGEDTGWVDMDYEGNQRAERQIIDSMAGDLVEFTVAEYGPPGEDRDQCTRAGSGFNLSKMSWIVRQSYARLAAIDPDTGDGPPDSAGIPRGVVRVSLSSDLSAEAADRAVAFEDERAELLRERKPSSDRDRQKGEAAAQQGDTAGPGRDAGRDLPKSGFAVLLDELKGSHASQSRSASPAGNGTDRDPPLETQRVASAGSVVYISETGSGTATAHFVAGRGKKGYRGAFRLGELQSIALPLTPENTADYLAPGLARSRLLGNAKEWDYFEHPVLEDIRAGRLALASLPFRPDTGKLPAQEARAMLPPGGRAPFAGMVTIRPAESGADVVVALDRGWWLADNKPAPACLTVPRSLLPQLQPFPLEARPDAFENAVMDDLSGRFGEETVEASATAGALDATGCEQFAPERILYSEDRNEDGLFEIDLLTRGLRNIGGLNVDSETLGLASDKASGVLYASLWTPLAEVRLETGDLAAELTEFGGRGAEGLAFDDVDGWLYASRGKEFFVHDVNTGGTWDVVSESAVPWDDAECLAIDTAARRIFAISGRALWAYDIGSQAFERVREFEREWTACGLAYSPAAGNLIAFGHEAAPRALFSLDPQTGESEVILETGRVLRGGLTILPADPAARH